MTILCLRKPIMRNWFDRVVLQTKSTRTYPLASGEQVVQPFSFMPLILLVLLVLIAIGWDVTSIRLDILWQRFSNFFDILLRMNNPDWSYLERVRGPMLDTIQMSFLGSLL